MHRKPWSRVGKIRPRRNCRGGPRRLLQCGATHNWRRTAKLRDMNASAGANPPDLKEMFPGQRERCLTRGQARAACASFLESWRSSAPDRFGRSYGPGSVVSAAGACAPKARKEPCVDHHLSRAVRDGCASPQLDFASVHGAVHRAKRWWRNLAGAEKPSLGASVAAHAFTACCPVFIWWKARALSPPPMTRDEACAGLPGSEAPQKIAAIAFIS